MRRGNRFFLIILTGLLLPPVSYAQQQPDAMSAPAPSSADTTSPVPENTAAPLHVSGDVTAGYIIKRVNPTYPKEARKKHITGTVVVHCIIDKQGDITDLKVISSPDQELSDATMQAIQQWKYKPYLLNGEPTEVDTTVTVVFHGSY